MYDDSHRLVSEKICNEYVICSSDNVLPEPSFSD